MTHAVMALSGGMDSTGLLLRLLAEGHSVTALSFRYGQKHIIEVHRASKNVHHLLQSADLQVDHRIVELASVMSLFKSALTSHDTDVPEGHYEQSNMKATVVPNRNAIFASIAYGVALDLATDRNELVKLSLGVHSGDHAIYPDCRPDFYDALSTAFSLGNWESELVEWYLPFIEGDKAVILRSALADCVTLGLDFDTIFANTNTSYNPTEDGLSSGRSGADIERILAFHEIGRKDPVAYVEPWESVLANALQVKADWDRRDV